MQIKFKDDTKLKCFNPKETMLFQNGKRAGWLFSFAMNVVNAKQAELVLTKDNLSEIAMESDDGSCSWDVGSYEGINSLVVSYDENGGIAEVQLKRGINDE